MMDRPRRADQGRPIPHISEHDPLPAQEPPKGRWGEPYMGGNGEWKVFTRHPLSAKAVQYGLKSQLMASSFAELQEKMVEEDRRWNNFVVSTQPTRDTT